MIWSVTGHRPKSMGLSYAEDDLYRLAEFAIQEVGRVAPAEVILGMAQGWDQAVAFACIYWEIPYIAAVPFEGQERMWPNAAQSIYRYLLGSASRVVRVSKYAEGNVVHLMHRRNHWMVDNSVKLLALWNGRPGGTGECVKYAEAVGKPVEKVWDRWEKFKA